MRDRGTEHWWWLSFCDTGRPVGSQFLGVTIVRGCDLGDAIRRAWRHGCNPGGQVAGFPMEDPPPSGFTSRLLSKAECEAFDRAIGGPGEVVTTGELVDRGELEDVGRCEVCAAEETS